MLTSCRSTIKATFQNVLLWQQGSSPTLCSSSTMDLPSSPCPLCFIYLFLICLPQIFPLTQQHILLRCFKNRWLKLRTLHKNVEPLRHMENVRNKSLSFTFCMDWELFCTDILILSTGNTLRIQHHWIYRQ